MDQKKLEAYADLIVETGINPEAGQELKQWILDEITKLK